MIITTVTCLNTKVYIGFHESVGDPDSKEANLSWMQVSYFIGLCLLYPQKEREHWYSAQDIETKVVSVVNQLSANLQWLVIEIPCYLFFWMKLLQNNLVVVDVKKVFYVFALVYSYVSHIELSPWLYPVQNMYLAAIICLLQFGK